MRFSKWWLTIFLALLFFPLFAESSIKEKASHVTFKESDQNVVAEKIEYEAKQDADPFAISAHEPNYFLPFNYTTNNSSPGSIYNKTIVHNQKIQKVDFKFQFSLKTPIWRDFFGYSNVLYLAYTQQSFWQAYNSSPFFRANNYQPEIFVENNVDLLLPYCWSFQLFNVGVMHQSNGRGGPLERTWNRVYVEATFSKDDWLISFKPWFILQDNAYRKHNPDMGKYLGYGRTLIAYKFGSQVFSVVVQNYVETGFRKGSIQLNYSFPLIYKIKGYVQFFSGYGQNLITYDRKTSAVGVGVSLSDWL